jgi:uncharacterized protein (DUF1778 family)
MTTTKPRKKVKDARLHVRATPAQLRAYRRAANARGLGMASWVRSLLVADARAVGVEVPS